MHTNPAFRKWPDAAACAFARERGFGALTIAGEAGPLASHIPFLLSEDGRRAEFHLLRSSALSRALQGAPGAALLVVSGPDAYISPDWYGDVPDQVPTWNYQAVHLRGAARVLGQDALRPHLMRLSAHFEHRLAPKPPWTLDKMSENAIGKMLRAIAPAELMIDSCESTLKLGQNKSASAQAAAADGAAAARIGSEDAGALAALMRRSAEQGREDG